MAPRVKRQSMTEALGRSGEVMAFLREGTPSTPELEMAKSRKTSKPREMPVGDSIAVTVRLPRDLAHALIDASAERRKNRERAWSQQDIVAEAIEFWLDESKMKV